jgi:hypothetical protein
VGYDSIVSGKLQKQAQIVSGALKAHHMAASNLNGLKNGIVE